MYSALPSANELDAIHIAYFFGSRLKRRFEIVDLACTRDSSVDSGVITLPTLLDPYKCNNDEPLLEIKVCYMRGPTRASMGLTCLILPKANCD